MKFIQLYLTSIVVFTCLDFLWLGFVAKDFYKNQIGYLMRPDVNWVAAICFYIIFLVGVCIFVIQPAFEKQSIQHAIQYGALFGFVTYSAYDLTNLATTKDWPLLVTGVDLVWGAILTATVSAVTYIIVEKIF